MRYLTKKRKAASERARARANHRWAMDRARRDAVAAIALEQIADRIVRRIVVIDRETTVREAVLFDFDSVRTARRKLRDVLRGEGA